MAPAVHIYSLKTFLSIFYYRTLVLVLLIVMFTFFSFHIAQMQVGLSEPFRVGQAHKVEIILRGSAPMQTDGEPWEQHPATITVDHHRYTLTNPIVCLLFSIAITKRSFPPAFLFCFVLCKASLRKILKCVLNVKNKVKNVTFPVQLQASSGPQPGTRNLHHRRRA